MDQDQLYIAIRLLDAQRIDRVLTNDTIVRTFGDRITAALAYECDERSKEIAVFDALIAHCTEKLGGSAV